LQTIGGSIAVRNASVAIVGTGDHIGAAIARHFAGEGFIVHDGRRNGDALLPPDRLMHPASIAEAYWQLHFQPRDAWTHELDLRRYGESW